MIVILNGNIINMANCTYSMENAARTYNIYFNNEYDKVTVGVEDFELILEALKNKSHVCVIAAGQRIV